MDNLKLDAMPTQMHFIPNWIVTNLDKDGRD